MILKKIKDIGEIVSGATPKTNIEEYWDGNIPWVTPKDLSDLETPFLNDTERKITQAGFESCSTSMLPKGSILFSSRAPIGLVAVTNIEVCTNQGFKSIALYRDNYPLYIYYALKQNKVQLNNLGTGSTFKELSKSTFEKFEIPVHDIFEDQVKNATIIYKIEELILQRKRSIDLVDQYIKSVFFGLFGDPIKNEKQWITKQIKNAGIVTTGTTPPSSKKGMFGGIIPFITPGDLETFNPAPRFLTDEGAMNSRIVRKGATLVCCIGATIGKVGRASIQSAFNQQINAIEWGGEYNDLFGEMLMRFMKPIIIQNGRAGTTLPIINKTTFELLEIICPPLELQNQFAQIVEKAEAIKADYEKSLKVLEELFAALSQSAFRGELDLSKLDVSEELEKHLAQYGETTTEASTKETEKKEEIKEVADYQGKFYIEKPSNEKIESSTKPFSTLRIFFNDESVADQIKQRYSGGCYFNFEMLVKYLTGDWLIPYHSSEELMKTPRLHSEQDIRSFIYTAVVNKERDAKFSPNPFLKLEQVFYNAEEENFDLKVTDEDYQEIISKLPQEERSGIYFRIIEEK